MTEDSNDYEVDMEFWTDYDVKPEIITNHKPKKNYSGSLIEMTPMDCCQTPMYALDSLLMYLPQNWIVWESATGDGNLSKAMSAYGMEVISTDIQRGTNFFNWFPQEYNVQVTNPPYSVKYDWLKRSYELGNPFALLLPIDTIGAAKGQRLFQKYGVEIIYHDKRINFKMPGMLDYKGAAQFSTAWFTWGLEIGSTHTFSEIKRCTDEEWIINNKVG